MIDSALWRQIGLDEGSAEAELLRSDRREWFRSWAELLLSAEDELRRGSLPAARRLQEEAWRRAGDRATQGATLHHAGRRLWVTGELEAAAAHFELAHALRRGFVAAELTAGSAAALRALRTESACSAIVLTGGAGRRLGGAGKAELRLAGWPLADHVLLAVTGTDRRVVVGPERRGLAEPVFCREDPPGAGPVAAIRAAVQRVESPEVLVLAGDQPFIAGALAPLRQALHASAEGAADRTDVALLVDLDGRMNWLAARWRTAALARAAASLAEGAPVRALFDGVRAVTVADFEQSGQDCDTWDDLGRAETRVRQGAAGRVTKNRALLPQSPLAWPGLELHAPS